MSFHQLQGLVVLLLQEILDLFPEFNSSVNVVAGVLLLDQILDLIFEG